jgi:hypothetical protein
LVEELALVEEPVLADEYFSAEERCLVEERIELPEDPCTEIDMDKVLEACGGTQI